MTARASRVTARHKRGEILDRRENDGSSQHDAFIHKARELGCDEDPEAFKRALRQIAKAPPIPRDKAKKADDKPS